MSDLLSWVEINGKRYEFRVGGWVTRDGDPELLERLNDRFPFAEYTRPSAGTPGFLAAKDAAEFYGGTAHQVYKPSEEEQNEIH